MAVLEEGGVRPAYYLVLDVGGIFWLIFYYFYFYFYFYFSFFLSFLQGLKVAGYFVLGFIFVHLLFYSRWVVQCLDSPLCVRLMDEINTL